MKAKILVLGLVAFFVSSMIGMACEGPKNAKSAKKATSHYPIIVSSVTEKNIELTGSRLKQTVHRSGRITDGASPVIVIDRQTIDHTGAMTARGVLSLEGSVR